MTPDTLPADLANWQHLTRQNSHQLSTVVDGEPIRTRWRPDLQQAIDDARFLCRELQLPSTVTQLELIAA